MVAADDSAIRSAQRSQQADVCGRVDLEAVVLGGEVFRGMQRGRRHGIILNPALDQAAAFGGKGGAGLGRELRAQGFGKGERGGHWAPLGTPSGTSGGAALRRETT